MQPVQFGLWLQFAEEIRGHSLSYQISATLGGKSPQPERTIEPSVRFRLDEDKISVTWFPTYCYITSENVSDKKHCIDRIISVLEIINRVATIEKLSNRRFHTHWILPTLQYDFVSLERKYRETMITQNDVSNAAYDSTTIFDIRGDKWILHHQSGAMEPQQLQQTYLDFKLDNVPKTFIFLEATTMDKNVIQYSREEMRSFMERSLENCVSHMEEFKRIWEGRL